MTADPVILAEGVSFSYGGALALEGVDLTVNRGEAVCVVGPNGGGKSTLVKLILGLLKPDRGRLLLLGAHPEQTRSRVGYMPQYAHFDPRFPVTIMDVVLMGRLGESLGGPYTAADRERALEALEEMQLRELAQKPFSDLSGGQRQRVLIARALVCTGELLILDEPTTNIDPFFETSLFEILQELNKRMSILMVTHDLGFASKFFKKVVCVNCRTVIHPTSEISGETIKELYGGDICMIRHDRSH